MNVDTDIIQGGEIAKALGDIADTQIRCSHGAGSRFQVPDSRLKVPDSRPKAESL
jgi:hypothetical protein